MPASGEHRLTPSRASVATSDTSSVLSLSSSSNIKVIARFRPPNDIELNNNSTNIVQFLSEDSCQIDTKDFSGTFTFDQVFDTESQQEQVFEYSLRQTVDDLMKGYNGTVLAYGQTGSGKSYTMTGTSIDNDKYRGAIPRIVDMIFNMILHSSSDIEYTVRVSYMEIYMERIKDLLKPSNDNLPIHEDKTRGVYVKGLTEEYVSSAEEVYEVMRQGGVARAVGSTNMNQESSRSHSIFCIVVTQKNVVSGAQKSGQLFLVDLAGSEKVGKTGASGQTLEEAKKINKSLSALGMVINSLTDGKSTHIPYRDSKLTRILQESLGGNSRTSLIVNCSPSSYNDAETLSTLRFGVRAKNIRNKAKINTELSPLELRALLKKCQRQLDTRNIYSNRLEGELIGWRSGEPPAKETWVPLGGPPELKHTNSASTISLTPTTPRSTSSMSNRPTTPSNFRTGSRNAQNKRTSLQEPLSRPLSPGFSDIDSMEELLRRENELQDQLSEKESMISEQEQVLLELRSQLNGQKSGFDQEASDLRLQVDNLNYEKKELEIKSTTLKEENDKLNQELQDTKQKLLEMSVSNGDGGFDLPPSDIQALHDLKKKRKMTEILGSFYQSTGSVSSLSTLRVNSQTSETLEQAITMLEGVKLDDPEVASQISQAKTKLNLALDDITTSPRSLEDILEQQDIKFREYLDTISSGEKTNTEIAYEAQLRASNETASQLLAEISRLKGENKELSKQDETDLSSLSTQETAESLTSMESLSDRRSEVVVAASTIKENEKQAAAAQEKIQSMQSHIAQFENMKTALMKDLQDRCERVVELEISLDQAREQYNLAIRDGNNKQQQKKMAMLQRNLEQLTGVQRQLVEQNMVLKKDVAMAHKILDARNDRIQSLESALRDSQNRLGQESEIFETKLTYLRDRLMEVKRGGVGGASPVLPNGRRELMLSSYPTIGSLSGNRAGEEGSNAINSKIVKPLRGGGQQQPPSTPIKPKEGLWTKLNSIVNMTP